MFSKRRNLLSKFPRLFGRTAAVLALVSLLVMPASTWAQSESPLDAPAATVALQNALDKAEPDADEPIVDDFTVLKKELLDTNVINAVISLPAVKDTYVASNRSGTNFGGADTLAIGYNANGNNLGALRTLIQFNFPGSIPAGSTINSAKIRLYMYSATGESTMNTNARHLQSDWNEYEVTWSQHEPDWGSIVTYTDVGSSPGWVEWDITGLAKEWFNGTDVNDGVLIQGNEVPTEQQRAFWSRQAGNGLTPQLVVDYTAGAPDNTPPTSQVERPRNPYQTDPIFRVQWNGSDNEGGSGIDYYDVQYREPGGSWLDWQRQTRQRQAQFTGQDGRTYQFRVRAVDLAGNVEAWPDQPGATTTVDATPPVATIVQLPPFVGTREFMLSWSATDAVSGVANYDLQFQFGVQPWFDWVQDTTLTSAQATGDDGVRIQYRVRATDNAGNVSSYDASGATTSTTVDLTGPTARVLPFSPGETNTATFTVRWTGDDGAGSGVRTYDVRYRFNNGPWRDWQQQIPATNATFTAGDGEGVYSFQARATDNVGNTGAYGTENGTGILFNQGSIDLDMKTYMPLAANSD